MKRKWIALSCTIALLAFNIIGCGSAEEQKTEETATAVENNISDKKEEGKPGERKDFSEDMKNMQMGQILEISGNEITVALAAQMEMPEDGEKPDGEGMPEMSEKPEGEEMPEMGEKPEGEEMPEMGEKPEGEAPADGGRPDGNGKREGGNMPGGQFTAGDETLVITLSDEVEITSMNGETYSVEDLAVDMVISFTTDDNDRVTAIQVMKTAEQPEEVSGEDVTE